MTTPKEIFEKHYDNDNKICTRKSLWEQFKTVFKEVLQQKEESYKVARYDKTVIEELKEDLEK